MFDSCSRATATADCYCRPAAAPRSRVCWVVRGIKKHSSKLSTHSQVVGTAWACTCHLSAWAWAEFGERRAPRAASATCRPVPAEAHVERRLTRSLLQQWHHTTDRAGERGNPWFWTVSTRGSGFLTSEPMVGVDVHALAAAVRWDGQPRRCTPFVRIAGPRPTRRGACSGPGPSQDV
jgi:hypothetical protein